MDHLHFASGVSFQSAHPVSVNGLRHHKAVKKQFALIYVFYVFPCFVQCISMTRTGFYGILEKVT